MVLFTDAAQADLAVFRRSIGLTQRLLVIGLPLTIVLGFLVALLLFPSLDAVTAAPLLATFLAPTDAALGLPVVTNEAVPRKTREALNLESGLNDGISVPIVIVLLDVAVGSEIQHSPMGRALEVISQEIGIGVLVGAVLSAIAVWFLRIAARHDWTSEHWSHVPVVAVAGLCFASAPALGGSGFIACFVGLPLFGYLHDQPKGLLGGASSTGEILASLTWLAFGGALLGRLIDDVTWSRVTYAVVSLTVIRMASVFLSLLNSGVTSGTKLCKPGKVQLF
jgi:sodium/hydrogen antiporter